MLRRLVVRSCAAAAAAGAPRLAARPVASTPLRAAPRAAPQRTFAVKEITSQAELESVVRDNPGKLVVIDWSAEWCRPCKLAKPVVERMSEIVENAVFANIDVDKNGPQAFSRGITSVPHFDFYINGERKLEISGFRGDVLSEKVLELAKQAASQSEP